MPRFGWLGSCGGHLAGHLDAYNRLSIGVTQGIMEKKMETTIMGYVEIIGYLLGLYRE